MTDRELAVAVARAVGHPAGTDKHGTIVCPDYPTDLNAAWEAAVSLGIEFSLHFEPTYRPPEHRFVGIIEAGPRPQEQQWAGDNDSPARALCLAIVKAAEAK